MKLRHTSYHLTVAMTSETLMVTSSVGCTVDWFSRPSLQETGVVLLIFNIVPLSLLLKITFLQ